MSRSYKWIPVIDEDVCNGCGLCVEACGPQCLQIVKGIAVLSSLNACGSEEHCIAACPDDAIHMQWVPARGDLAVGKWSSNLAPQTGGPVASEPPGPSASAPGSVATGAHRGTCRSADHDSSYGCTYATGSP